MAVFMECREPAKIVLVKGLFVPTFMNPEPSAWSRRSCWTPEASTLTFTLATGWTRTTDTSCTMASTYPFPKGVFDDLSLVWVSARRKAPNTTWVLSEALLELMKPSNSPSRNDENWPCVEAT